MKLSRVMPFVGALSAVSFMGFGCNPVASLQQKVGDAVTNKIVDSVTGGKVNVDSGSKQVTYKDNTTGSSVAYGENVTIPADFPKDVPVYPGAKAIGVVMTKTGDQGASLTLKTDDDTAKVIAWYEDQLKASWKQDSSFTANDTEIRSYSKGTAKIALTVSPGDNDKGSVISITKSISQE